MTMTTMEFVVARSDGESEGVFDGERMTYAGKAADFVREVEAMAREMFLSSDVPLAGRRFRPGQNSTPERAMEQVARKRAGWLSEGQW